MKRIFNLFFFQFCALLGCNASVPVNIPPPIVEKKVLTGAENTHAYLPLLKDKRVACVVHHASRVGDKHLIDTLLALGVHIVKIMAPEHGFRGTSDAGEKIQNETDAQTGLPIVSLYGKSKKPTAAMLENVDIVLFDLQDVGARFYTYISTLHYVMEACGEEGKKLIVLDRPNPHAHYIDGPVLEDGYQSFIGMHHVPTVYGMTIGEYGKMINGEMWTNYKKQVDLTVVPCINFKRGLRYDIPLPPSPNLPNPTAVLLYPTLCFFEGTDYSVGRGTSKQFQVIGHPGMKGDFSFTPAPNLGAKDPFQNGKKCFGYDFSNTSQESLFAMKKIDLQLIVKVYTETVAANQNFFLSNLFFDKLAGTDKFRKMLIGGKSAEEIRSSWQPALHEFSNLRSKYLIYE